MGFTRLQARGTQDLPAFGASGFFSRPYSLFITHLAFPSARYIRILRLHGFFLEGRYLFSVGSYDSGRQWIGYFDFID